MDSDLTQNATSRQRKKRVPINKEMEEKASTMTFEDENSGGGPSHSARRLAQLRRRAGLSMSKMAQAMGVSSASTYQHYEARYKRRYLPLEMVRRIKSLLVDNGIPEGEVNALAGIEGLDLPGIQTAVDLLSWVEAGRMMDTDDPYPVGGVHQHVLVDSDRESLIGLRVVGTSMNRIAPEGAVIIVDFAEKELMEGRYYVVRHNGAATFKRFRDNPKRLEPYSTEPDHETLFASEGVEVVGRVIRITQDV